MFTEGPLWHPDDFYYFVDIPAPTGCTTWYWVKCRRVVRNAVGGNGTTFDLQGRLINCEGDGRSLTCAET